LRRLVLLLSVLVLISPDVATLRPHHHRFCIPIQLQLAFSHIYHFSHSLLDDGVEDAMSANMPPQTDSDETGTAFTYTGAQRYRGLGRSDSDSAAAGFPATAPFLKSTARFFLAPEVRWSPFFPFVLTEFCAVGIVLPVEFRLGA
jgi:hypothetical protein